MGDHRRLEPATLNEAKKGGSGKEEQARAVRCAYRETYTPARPINRAMFVTFYSGKWVQTQHGMSSRGMNRRASTSFKSCEEEGWGCRIPDLKHHARMHGG